MRTRTDRWFIVLALATSCASPRSDVDAVRDIAASRLRIEPTDIDVDKDVGALAARPLTVDNAVRIALLNNRALRAQLLELGIARGQLVQASVLPNPDIEAEVRFSEDTAQGPQWDLGVGVPLAQLLLVPARTGAAEATLDAARADAANAVVALATRTRIAVYDVQAHNQRLDAARNVLAALTASYDTARALHDVGNLTDLALLNEQSAYEGARAAVADSEANVVDAREHLNVLLGFFGTDTAWTLPSTLPDAPPDVDALGALDGLEGRAIDASIDLASKRASIVAAARRLGVTNTAGLIPDVLLGVHAEFDGTSWEAGPSLTGSLPVFDRQQGNSIAAQAELDGLRARAVDDAVAIRAAVRATRARLVSAHARSRQLHDAVLPLRERLVRETVLQYNAMQVGVFEVLQARREQIEAGHLYANVLMEFWTARATLDQLLAGSMAGVAGRE
jgi:outer membrane protein, heavy metal efflux system